jgi:Zn-dependent M28 family amino/carboxypeptidase
LGIRPDQPGDNIYNGAVDNATGIAGILAIAKACTSLTIRPKRSILFIAATASSSLRPTAATNRSDRFGSIFRKEKTAAC